MWTPHFMFDILAIEAGTAEAYKASLIDFETRKFCVQFFIEDMRLRGREVKISMFGGEENRAIVDGDGKRLLVKFQAGASGCLDRIACVVDDNTALQALWYCHNRLSPLLSYWTLVFGGPMRIWGARISDRKYKLRVSTFPDTVLDTMDPAQLHVPSSVSLTSTHHGLLSLYREGRNSSSPFYSLLCMYKIMEGVLKNNLFASTDVALRELGLSDRRARGVISGKHLERCRAHKRFPEYEGMKFSKFIDEIADMRNRIAHAVTAAGEMCDFDQFHEYVDVVLVAGVADIVAREILVEEFRLVDALERVRNAGSVESFEAALDGSFKLVEIELDPDNMSQLSLDMRK